MSKLLRIRFIVALFVMIVASSLPASLWGEENQSFTVDGITYTVIDQEAKTVELTRGARTNPSDNSTINVVVSEQVIAPTGETYKVISLGDNSYSDTSIESIVFPETIVSIGESAFYSCDGLTEISIPGSVEQLGPRAFGGCPNLYKVVFESSETPLFMYEVSRRGSFTDTPIEELSVFRNLVNANGTQYICVPPENLRKVELGGLITEIGQNAFNGASLLEEIVIPETVTSIGSHAFGNCAGLTGIIIPGSLESIDAAAFDGCDNLRTLVIEESSNPLNVSGGTFGNDPIETIKVYRDINSDQNFYDTSYLRTVELGGSITKIWPWAFSGASNLTTITIPESLKEIGWSAFDGCANLSQVIFPETLQTIGKQAFGNCTGLREIIIPGSVESIGYGSFYGCGNLRSLVIAESNNPLSLSYGYELSDAAFGSAPIETLKVYRDIEVKPEFANASVYDTSNLRSVELGGSITKIWPWAFSGASKLTTITIPESVKEIGWSAFDGCENLSQVIFPENLQTIVGQAFGNCTGLTEIIIPGSVESIDAVAFNGCDNLRSLVIEESCNPLNVSGGAFGNDPIETLKVYRDINTDQNFYDASYLGIFRK